MAESREYGHIINPILTRHTLNPGATISGSFQYSNSFTETEDNEITLQIKPYFVFQQNGTPTIFDVTPTEFHRYDMSSWVTVTNNVVTVKKGIPVTVNYVITVPDDARPGGKYAVILMIPEKLSTEELGNIAKLNAQIGYTMLGVVPGEVSANSQVLDFRVEKFIYWFWPKDTIAFETTVNNIGNVDYLPKGNIFLHRGDITKPFHVMSINSENLVVLPENTRTFGNTWSKNTEMLRITDGGAFLNIEYFRFGKITATAKVGYELEGQRLVAEREIAFWILPLPLIIAILILILVSSLGVILWRKRKSRLQR